MSSPALAPTAGGTGTRSTGFGSTVFDVVAPNAPRQRGLTSAFDVCHVGVVLRALLFVHGAMAIGMVFGASTFSSWLALTAAGASVDEQAIARYRYLLKTAPPEAIEQAHAEALARLTPEQRQRLLSELASDMPDAERNAAYRAGEAPGALARVATQMFRSGVLSPALSGRLDAM